MIFFVTQHLRLCKSLILQQDPDYPLFYTHSQTQIVYSHYVLSTTINQTIKHIHTFWHTNANPPKSMSISDFNVTALFVPFSTAYRYNSPQDEHETNLNRIRDDNPDRSLVVRYVWGESSPIVDREARRTVFKRDGTPASRVILMFKEVAESFALANT